MAKVVLSVRVPPEVRRKINECQQPGESISRFVLAAIVEYLRRVEEEMTIYVDAKTDQSYVGIGVFIDESLRDRLEELAEIATRQLGFKVSIAAIVRKAIEMKLEECMKFLA